MWQQKHAADMIQISSSSIPAVTDDDSVRSRSKKDEDAVEGLDATASSKAAASASRPFLPRTPLHILADNSTLSSKPPPPPRMHKPVETKTEQDVHSDVENSPNGSRKVRSSHFGEGSRAVPWSSPSLRSSPTDQLIAAILDGDVQVTCSLPIEVRTWL